MNLEGKYVITKDIPLNNGNSFKKGREIYLSAGLFYITEGLLDKEFQDDFKTLLLKEVRNGWNYLKPID